MGMKNSKDENTSTKRYLSPLPINLMTSHRFPKIFFGGMRLSSLVSLVTVDILILKNIN
jgi:hypothetical protein